MTDEEDSPPEECTLTSQPLPKVPSAQQTYKVYIYWSLSLCTFTAESVFYGS